MERAEASPHAGLRSTGGRRTRPTREPEAATLRPIRRVLLLGALPLAVFEVILLLVPVWAPDESISGVLISLPFYALFIASPGLVLATVTRPSLLVYVDAVVLCAAAAWAAIAMVSSDDAQAGLAVLVVWYFGVPLLLLSVLIELFASRPRGAR